MPNIIIMVGPPGCGKSIWSKLYIENHKAKRLNRDDMRLSMQGGLYTDRDEKVIKRIRNYAVESWLQMGYDVVIDDTNLTPDVFPAMQKIARRVGNVGVKEHIMSIERGMCWYNNSSRSSGVVPLDRWNEMWEQFINFGPHGDYYAPPRQVGLEMYLNEYLATDLPQATIVDLDETMAFHVHGRDPYDHSRIPNDLPNGPLADMLALGGHTILVTGRSEISREATEKWLKTHEIEYELLLMRPLDQPDTTDHILKKEIYEKHIKDKYFINAVFEDREQNVEMWRDLGLITYHINFGRY